jgi:hypothetical protein
MWLYAITWPANAGYVLAEDVWLADLADHIPAELVFGATTRRLYPHGGEEYSPGDRVPRTDDRGPRNR